MIGVIAVMSYAGASLLVEANKTNGWVTVPQELRGGTADNPDLYAVLVVTFFLVMIGFGLVTIIYSIIYRATRPRDIYKLVK